MNANTNAARRAWSVHKTVRGLVLPVEQDEDGNLVRCSIITDDDDEFEVHDDDQGRELCLYVDEEVVAKGIVRYDQDGPDRMRVDSFRTVEWEDDLDEDEYDTFGDDDD